MPLSARILLTSLVVLAAWTPAVRAQEAADDKPGPLHSIKPLAKDGSYDGKYQLEIVVNDRAGNSAMGTASFEYSHSTTGTTSVIAIHELHPLH